MKLNYRPVANFYVLSFANIGARRAISTISCHWSLMRTHTRSAKRTSVCQRYVEFSYVSNSQRESLYLVQNVHVDVSNIYFDASCSILCDVLRVVTLHLSTREVRNLKSFLGGDYGTWFVAKLLYTRSCQKGHTWYFLSMTPTPIQRKSLSMSKNAYYRAYLWHM